MQDDKNLPTASISLWWKKEPVLLQRKAETWSKKAMPLYCLRLNEGKNEVAFVRDFTDGGLY